MEWFIGVLVYGILSALVLVRTEVRGGTPTGRCGDCRYDLAGLPRGARCPECGSTKLEQANAVSVLTLNRARVARWLPSLLTLAGSVITAWVLGGQLLITAYLHEGFTLEQARHVIPLRGRDDDIGGLFLPLVCLLAASPLTALLGGRRQAIATCIALAVVGLIMGFLMTSAR